MCRPGNTSALQQTPNFVKCGPMQEPATWLWPCKCNGHMPGRKCCSTAPAPVRQRAVTCAQAIAQHAVPKHNAPSVGAAQKLLLLYRRSCSLYSVQFSNMPAGQAGVWRLPAVPARTWQPERVCSYGSPFFLSQRPLPPLVTHLVLPAHRDQAERSEAEDGSERWEGQEECQWRYWHPGPQLALLHTQGRTTFEPSTPVR